MWLFGRRNEETQKLDLTKVQVQPFNSSVVLNRFECGARPLDVFIKNKAKSVTRRFEFSIFVATLQGSPNCIGYYALQLGSDSIPDEFKAKRQDYVANYAAFPAVHLSYLAVHSDYQRQGLGKHLLQDAFERVAKISEFAGFYAMTLQSYDENSTKFYRAAGFEEYSEGGGQPKMLYPLVNIKKLIAQEY